MTIPTIERTRTDSCELAALQSPKYHPHRHENYTTLIPAEPGWFFDSDYTDGRVLAWAIERDPYWENAVRESDIHDGDGEMGHAAALVCDTEGSTYFVGWKDHPTYTYEPDKIGQPWPPREAEEGVSE